MLVVTGSGFPTGQPLGIYLDQAGNGMGPVFCAAPDGSFRQSVTIPFFARTGDRQVCATSLVAVACARFQVLPITNAAPTPAATPVATPVPTPVPTATLVPGPTPTETASPSAATIGPATITGTPLGSSALSTLFPWILIPIAALLALAGLVVWLLRRGQSTPPGARRKFGPTGGSGIPTITHRSPQPIGSMPGARRRGEPPPDRPLTVEWMPGDPLPNEPPPAGLPPVPQNELISAPDEPAGRRAEPGADDGASVQSGSPIITHRSPQPFGGLPAADPGPPAGGDKPE